jgi:hypothetical protein
MTTFTKPENLFVSNQLVSLASRELIRDNADNTLQIWEFPIN